MNPALKAIIEAMAAEFADQALMRVPVSQEDGVTEVDLSSLDLERVARAVLRAAKALPHPVAHKAGDAARSAILEQAEAHARSGPMGVQDSWSAAPGAAAFETAIDEILKEAP